MTHLAILKQPFLNFILSGEKIIETRWSKNKIAPYKNVNVGDLIYLKETGKDCYHTAVVSKVEFYELTPKVADEIKQKYGPQICIKYFTNWEEVSHRKYASLVWLCDVKECKVRRFKNYGMRGWVILDGR